MEEEYFKKITTTIIFAVLIILSFFLLKSLLISIIVGIILAFVFIPVYNFIYKHLKKKDISAFLVCLILLAVIILPLWYLTPIVIDQSIKLFTQSSQIDFGMVFQKMFPSLAQSETLLKEVSSTLSSFITKTSNSMLESISKFLINIPALFLHLVVIFFVFFFVLRDKENLNSYIRSLIPFSKEIQDKLFKSSGDITNSVIYGRIGMGIAQGLIVGIGFFVFGVPNALLLTALAAFAGILPIIGTVIVWLPVSIFLIVSGESFTAFGVIAFGILATIFESIFQPILLAKMVKMNSLVMLVGMIGGLFLFGILGVILGPLILAYLVIILEIYRDKKIPGVFIEQPNKA